MQTVFLGTSEFAAVVLRRLASSPHRPALVISRPDSPRGRGRRLTPPPVAQVARELGLELDQPARINEPEPCALIASARPSVVCVCAYGSLIKEPLLSAHPILGVHPSLLPRWRGAAPIERAIMAGDEHTGISIMRVTAGLDCGPVCLAQAEAIEATDTYGTLSARLQGLGGELLVRALTRSRPCIEQDNRLASYAEKISAEDRILDPIRPAIELERVVRALTPDIGAHLELEDGTWLGVREARVLADDEVPARTPGTLSLKGPRPILRCARGALELVVVQPPGRRAITAEDYLRGLRGHGHR